MRELLMNPPEPLDCGRPVRGRAAVPASFPHAERARRPGRQEADRVLQDPGSIPPFTGLSLGLGQQETAGKPKKEFIVSLTLSPSHHISPSPPLPEFPSMQVKGHKGRKASSVKMLVLRTCNLRTASTPNVLGSLLS